jgi:hypothetical protein
MALLVMFGRPPRNATALAARERQPIEDTLDDLSRRRAQIAARRALQL